MGGICATPTEEKAQSNAVDAKMKKDKIKNENVVKLLFLGGGGSGKSTLFKQLKTIHGTGIQESERKTYTDIVYHNIIDGIQILCEQSVALSSEGDGDEDFKDCTMNKATADSAQFMMETREDSIVDNTLHEHISKIWKDSGIQNTYLNRHMFQIQESIEYFCADENLARIAKEDYIPSLEDVLRCRLRTSGIVEQKFVIPNYEQSPFLIVDVGGQRNERSKWYHCFDDVTAIIFVAALSSYDQVLYEDDSVNRMDEALTIWKDIVEKKIFLDKALILFLNKRDLFEQKIKTRPLSVTFPDFKVDVSKVKANATEDEKFFNELNQSLQYILTKFKNVCPGRKVMAHFTTATDTNLVKKIFLDVQRVVIEKSFELAGLV